MQSAFDESANIGSLGILSPMTMHPLAFLR